MRPRGFGLWDAMVLVAAVATGLWFNRMLPMDLPAYLVREETAYYFKIHYLLALVVPHVAACTVAVLVLRLRQPRPPLRRLVRPPGVIACAVASLCLMVLACWVLANSALGRITIRSAEAVQFPNSTIMRVSQLPRWQNLLPAYADRIGFAVAGSWLALVLGGRWRPESGWIDRLGRALGWCWIGVLVVIWLRSFLICEG